MSTLTRTTADGLHQADVATRSTHLFRTASDGLRQQDIAELGFHVTSVRPFAIGVDAIRSVRPFLIGGTPLSLVSIRPFVILDSELEVYVPPAGAPPTPLPVLRLFDKAGIAFATVTKFEVQQAPSRIINGHGNATLMIPRIAAVLGANDSGYVQDDRIVLLDDPGGKPWAGSIEPRTWADDSVTVQVPDLTTLMDVEITFKQTVPDNTPATVIYGKVLDLFNAIKLDHGEVQWARAFDGTKPFRGDIDFKGSLFDALTTIAKRSGTEWCWQVNQVDGDPITLVPVLVVSDHFTAVGDDLFDGDGGNVLTNPSVVEDPTQVFQAVHLVGATTDIASLVPDWAQWAVHEIDPEVTLAGAPDPGPDPAPRFRTRHEEVLDWSLSHTEQQRLANLTTARVRAMFDSFLRAVHDQWGRPWHEGWVYQGPPDTFEPKATRDRWIGERQLLEYGGQPVASVMRSGPKSRYNLHQRLIVRYNRATGAQTIQAVADRSLVGNPVDCTGVIATGHRARLWSYESGKLNGGSEIYGPLTFKVGELLTAQEGLVSVTYRYGGLPQGRGEYTVPYAGWHRRTSPFLRSDNIIGSLAAGTEWRIDQTTYVGSAIYGDRRWRGNAAGNVWIHNSALRYEGPREPVLLTVRPILTGPYAGYFVSVGQIAVSCLASSGTGSTLIGKVYGFEASRIGLWDPRRDGIGVLRKKTRVVYGGLQAKARWDFRSWAAGPASTSLANPISATATTCIVDSAYGFRTPPFPAILGGTSSGEVAETVIVTATNGANWTIVRGTPHVIHEAGSAVNEDAPAFDGFEFDHWWQEGEAWAKDVLEASWIQKRKLDVIVGNDVNFDLGSVHSVTLLTDGPIGAAISGPYTATVRVLGWARDVLEGRTALFVEEVL